VKLLVRHEEPFDLIGAREAFELSVDRFESGDLLGLYALRRFECATSF